MFDYHYEKKRENVATHAILVNNSLENVTPLWSIQS